MDESDSAEKSMGDENEKDLLRKIVEEHTIPKDREAKVLVIYFSGSFGCIFEEGKMKYVLEEQCRNNPSLCEKIFTEEKKDGWIYTPITEFKRRTSYKVRKLEKIRPSSEMQIRHMKELGKIIQEEYDHYDAFVILSGTDTITYFAPLLSFMLEYLNKSVIITGCFLPLIQMRNDATNNIATALTLAGHYIIPEVTVLFQNRLYRGNRIIKNSQDFYETIESRVDYLAMINPEIYVDWHSIIFTKPKEKLKVSVDLETDLVIIPVSPFLSLEQFNALFSEDIKGVILETYGSGNFPSKKVQPKLHSFIEEQVKKGILFINISQCKKGEVVQEYEGAVELMKLGVIPGYDMTVECTLAKMSYVMGKKLPMDEVKKMMVKNLRGEITNTSDYYSLSVNNPQFIIEMSKLVNQTYPSLTPISGVLLPALLSEAAALGQKKAFAHLAKLKYSVNQVDYEGRTPLHIAAIFGKIETGEELIANGIDINALDNNGNTALYYAIKHKNYEMAKILRSHKGILQARKDDLEKMILNAGIVGKLQRLKSIHECGCEINILDEINSRSVAHLAAINHCTRLFEYLSQSHPKLLEQKDRFGKLPRDYLN